MSKKFFFLTTNNCWGASELLWYETAKNLANRFQVRVYVPNYQHAKVSEIENLLGKDKVYNRKRKSILRFYKRWINKIYPLFSETDFLQKKLIEERPDLVIISNGFAFGNVDVTLLVKNLGFKYVIVNHLVSEVGWPSLDLRMSLKMMEEFNHSIRNYFVSAQNILLLSRMIGSEIKNTEVVFNPIEIQNKFQPPYPKDDTIYSVAFVGRLECFHKGLDVLVEVIKEKKWQERPIEFNLYGEGPHKFILESWIEKYQLKNVNIKGHVSDKSLIWELNHILILPSRMEGQSIALSEALYFQRCVIGTNVGGIEEFISDNETGFIAAYSNAYHLEEALERAWQRRHEWNNMGKRACEEWSRKVAIDPIEKFSLQLTELI